MRSPDPSPRPRERVRERSPYYEPKNKNQVQIQQFRGNSAAELSTFLGTLQWVFREHPSHYRDEQRRIRLAAGHLSQTLRRDFLDNLHLKYDGSEENMSWENMEEWLWSNINNPRGRTRTAYASLTKLQQKPKQSFREFFRQYRAIESELPHTVPDWLRIEMFLFCCNKSIKDLFRSQNYPKSWNDLVEKGYEYDDDFHEKEHHPDPRIGESGAKDAMAGNDKLTEKETQQTAGPHRLLSENEENWIPYQFRQDGRWSKRQMALLDQGSHYNLISPKRLTQQDWQRVEATSEIPETANHEKIDTQGTIHILFKATDSWGTEKILRVKCFVSSTADEEGLWLGKPWLKHVSLLLEGADHLTWAFAAPPRRASFVHGAKQIRRLTKTHFPIPISSEIDNRAEEPVEDASPPEIPSAYQEWADVFSEEEAAKLPPLSGRSHPIDLEEGQIPPSGPIYNLSEHELAVLREYIASAQKKGWIRRSISPAGSPILFVPKKGGQLRLCVDYRGLNKITKKNRTALPLISAILDRLGRAKLFTKLDLKDAYHRLRIRQGDEWKTAFRCHYGHYEYQVMPFGLVNAPASFQQYINDALEGLVDITCVVYLDDILIFSEHAEQHEDDVKEVLRRLRKAGLYANLRKCEFSVRRVSFLGFVIDDEGIHMEEERVRAVAEWPAPRCVKDIQVFLGFTGFYRRFIKNYSRIVSPLTDCLGKRAPRPWLLEPRAVRAFEDLKTAFQNGPILKHFDPSKPIRIETDASQFAIGAIISQLHYDRWHPVAFLSRKLQDAETRYAVPDCELLAITEAFRQWRHYLAYTSQKITVLTDHLNHKYFLSKPKLTNRQVNALDQLCSFDFEIVYRPGLKNPADGLSRRPDHEDFMEIAGLRDSRVARVLRTSRTTSQEEGTAVTAPALQETLQEALLAAQRGDAFVAQQKQLVSVPDSATAGKLSSEAWSTNDEGFLCYDKRIFVPAGLRNEILILFHDDEVAGHQGGTKTCKRIQAQYYWPGLRRDVRRYVSTCRECQLAKPRHHKPYGLLAPLPAPERPWQEISMDFITDLPTVRCEKKTYSGILVVVDRLTRYGRFIPVSARITSDGLATVFLREIFSTAFHPQTDGQTERINQTIEQYLRTFCNKEQSDWIDKLPMAEFTYNTSYHGTVKAAPAEVLMGYQPRSKGHVKGQLEAFSPNAMGRVRGLRELHERTALLIGNAQERQAHYYNKGREPKSFHEGDWVLISTKHLPLRRPTKKLTEKYVGPYQIERVIGGHKLAYRLRLPSTVRIHNVLPMSSLEPYLSRDKRPVEPEDNPFMAETTYDVEQILDHRGPRSRRRYLVKWKGHGEEENSWVSRRDFADTAFLADYDRSADAAA
ncbi:FHA domain-containing protein [Purpureocillium lavendulum]|uniref:FHA domain-containing protein n=1 Tax=Purpureocillium lavendulum TaxID=1247861 RepID=A0AB34FEF2_9HYPO|nr:FHA domain-containing protein [Purpureocillium lavendulum]